MHPCTHFTGNGSHFHVCLLLVIKIKTCTYQLCKRQSADTNVLIGRYQLSAVYRCISTWKTVGGRCDYDDDVCSSSWLMKCLFVYRKWTLSLACFIQLSCSTDESTPRLYGMLCLCGVWLFMSSLWYFTLFNPKASSICPVIGRCCVCYWSTRSDISTCTVRTLIQCYCPRSLLAFQFMLELIIFTYRGWPGWVDFAAWYYGITGMSIWCMCVFSHEHQGSVIADRS